MAKEHIYSVKEITRQVRGMLENEFPDVWVRGEICDLSKPTSGHVYFVLKDEESQLNAALFGYLRKGFKFSLEEGLQIIAHGRISVYERQGRYQLIIDKIEPAGKGALQLAFEQLKTKLEKEGLYEPSHKKPIPLLPGRIGVVTSPTGAAIRDILNIIERRFPNMEIILYPVRVQGKEAPREIVEAVESFNQRKDVDVLIVGRGGGSIEDLWAFNEEAVARSIYASRIPVISAVGHEIDFTIADFVADLRAPTPSAAAELVVPHKGDLLKRIESMTLSLIKGLANKLEISQNRLSLFLSSYVFQQPKDRIIQYQQHLDEITMRSFRGMNHRLELRESRFRALLGKLDTLSPLSVLERGYSICRKLPERKVIRDTREVLRGDRIEVKVSRGEMVCGVEEVRVEQRNQI